MLLQRRSWLWLYIRIGVILGDILGRKPSIREQHGGNSCYQLNRLFCDFQEADNYCHAQRGRLAHTWNPKLRGFLKSFLNEETVWWVRGNLTLPGSHPGINQTGGDDVLRNQKPGECPSVVTHSNAVFSRWNLCIEKHHFICQAAAFPPQGASIWRNEFGPGPLLPMKRRGAETERHMIPGNGPPLAMCHQPAPPELFETLCFPIDPASSAPPKATHRMTITSLTGRPQVTSDTLASSSPPQGTSDTPASSSPPQVTSATSASSSPPQGTSDTPASSSPPQVTSATSASSSPPQGTSDTPASSSPPQVTSATSASSSPPQGTSDTPASSSPPQVTSATSASSSPPQGTSDTPASSSPPQGTLDTPSSSSPPQGTSDTPASSSPPQGTSETPASNSPPQGTSETPGFSSPPQVTTATLVSSSPPQVTSETPASSSPTQVTSETPASSSPTQVTSDTPASNSPPQGTSDTPGFSSPTQVTTATLVSSSPPQVTSDTPASSSPPQVTSDTPASSSPPQVTSETPASSSPPQVTSDTSASISPPQVISDTPASSSPPQVTSETPASSSPTNMTSDTPASSSPTNMTSDTPASSSPTNMTSDTPASSSPPWPVITEVTRPESTIPAGRSLANITSKAQEDSPLGVISTHPQMSFQSSTSQALDETAGERVPTIPDFQAHSEFQKACAILQRLRDFLPTSPTSAQKNNSWSSQTPAVSCPFQPLGRLTTTEKSSHQMAQQDMEQHPMDGAHNAFGISAGGSEIQSDIQLRSEFEVEDMLETSLMALGEIHRAFCQQSLCPQSAVTLASPSATLMLSSQNVSTLPLSTYTLGEPAPLTLGFPSAEALKELLNKHPGVNLQVTGLAFNPFKTLDDKNIVGSIGNVQLSSAYQSIRVHDLIEDIEIMLWRNASMETQPTSLNTSTDHFTISVNITSLEKTLIVTIEPESPLLMTLHLGFQDQLAHTHFYLNISLPRDQVWQKDEEYTWVLTPENLWYGTGTYYIMAVENKSTEAAQHTPVLVSVVTAVTQCYFWDRYNRTWKSDGCQVGPKSTILKTQCLCDHLTFFSSDFFIVPRTVDVENTIKLLLHVTNNPVGVSLLSSLLGFYILLAMWASRKDREDMQKVKVTVLADNDPSSASHYLIQVYTGYRRRAATTAKVVITLYGSEGHSEPHHLCDPEKTVFERGALDVFLLSTGSWLGDLHGLRLWHDNSGDSPSWYVSQVIVSDMTTRKKWHFQCNCWLAVDLGNCERDRVFTPASRSELSSFRHLFSSTIVEKFTQDYLWLSVATRHPWNQFTRVQRLSCCMALLLCDMVINIMFWKMGGTTAKRGTEQLGPLAVTLSELLVSIQTSIILFPIHLIFGRLFQLIHPPEALPQLPFIQAAWPPALVCESPSLTQVVKELKETVGFLLRRNTQLLSECEPSSCSSCDINKLAKLLSGLIYCHLEDEGCHQQTESHWEDAVSENHYHFCRYLLQLLRRLKAHLEALGATQDHQSCDFSEAVSQLQNLQELLETQTLRRGPGPCRHSTSFPILSPGEGKKPMSFCLFRWLKCSCWLLLGVISLASAFFITLYSLELDKDQATSWVISMMLSVLQDIFISQPIKVIFLTLLFSLMANHMPWLNKDKEQHARRIVALWAKCPWSAPGLRDKNNPIYTAPAMNNLAKPTRKAWKKQLSKLTGGTLVQILFLTLLMTTVYSAKDSSRFFLHRAIWKRFSHRFSEIKTVEDFYPWANGTLLPNLYGDYRGFITDGNSFLLGNVLIRQTRIPNDIFFPGSLHKQMKSPPQHQEDRENYGAGWVPPDTNITKVDSIWHYQNQESLGGYPIQGELATYSGGGYVVRLGRNHSAATRVLQHLEQRRWLDHCTKALFVEFTVFNANVNLLCAVTLILESSGVGTFLTSLQLDSLTSLQSSERGFAWIVSQVVYYLLVCYYAFIQGCRLKRQRLAFFTRKRNLLDTSIVLISFSILGLSMQSLSLLHKKMQQYHCDRDRFISFYEALRVNSAVTHLRGFLLLFATVRVWDLLRHHAQLQVINKTLSKAWDEVLGFILIIVVLLSSYAMTFNLLFGWSISDYQSFFRSIVTVVGLLMGTSKHKEVIALYPILGSLLVLSSIILMGLVIINLFVSAILIAFGKERKACEKEATLTDMLLQKLSSLLGIRLHQNPSEEHADNTGSSNLRERSSKSMSSDAEVLAPADAVGSVSGTDGNSGSTKVL
ncbi:polycystin-1-like protein 3 isoform a precursor [Mus musculus]|uniref:Isoform 1 of Polycystin-1-like protein 3 n=1 Tax=Mus musculus TaxID=10090 RepID=Q2EG98-1|nr:polycystin-1-like protein 3 isoform a precursor [Mus musculus]Q2EG98.2 RecName: Full=Polycystin-1-like protein 3; Short=Polycystin-1L3; AltName: Full=PC1-like 3 protein; AltName: Full=Polycystic kidney disease protein 1-like 3; Flags: Precursor [Mus musculus]|eukprot:NP_001034789.2 polycystic kidney disease protein 1-like 3 isoform a precursor [Mus musculus]